MPHTPVAERRTQLLDAAWTVMTSRGLAAATTRAICAQAGVSQGAFHYCFTSRDEMLREVAVRLLPSQVAAATAAGGSHAESGGDPLAGSSGASDLPGVIEAALGAYWRQVEADVAAHQVLYEITVDALRRTGSRDVAAGQYRGFLSGARAVLDRIAEAHGIMWRRPVETLARQVVTIVDGLTLHYLVDGDGAAARAALAAFAVDLAAAAEVPVVAADAMTDGSRTTR